MKRWGALLGVAAAMLLLHGCDGDLEQRVADLEQQVTTLQSSHQTMVDSLTVWSANVYEWQQLTYRAICDIKAKNVPDAPYHADTNNYCGPGDGTGTPKPPPPWGT